MKLQLALDIGSSHIKTIEGYSANGTLFIRDIGLIENPVKRFRDGLNEHEQDDFVKHLVKFLKERNIRARATICNAGGEDTIVHYFDIPKIPKEEILSAVNLEMIQVMPPLGTKNLEYDYMVLPGEKKDTLLFAGYSKDKCNFFINSLQRAGLNPLIMDHDSFAILNAFNFLNKEKREVSFILNIGASYSNFSLAETDGFILIRDIPFGGKNIIDTLAENMGDNSYNADLGEEDKEDSDRIREIISEKTSDLTSEVSKSVEYFKIKTGKVPDTLFLTGGASYIPYLTDSFQQVLDIEIKLWNPLLHLPEKSILTEEIQKKGRMFAVATGLLLRKIK